MSLADRLAAVDTADKTLFADDGTAIEWTAADNALVIATHPNDGVGTELEVYGGDLLALVYAGLEALAAAAHGEARGRLSSARLCLLPLVETDEDRF